MTKITHDQLLEYLRGYGTAVHCEMYSHYQQWYSDDDSQTKYYYDRGCAVVVEDYEYKERQHIFRKIHQVSPDADIEAVTAEWQTEVSEYAKKYVNPDIWVIMYYVSNGDLPPEKDKFYGWRNFSRKGEKYPADERVRELTLADSEIIKSACTPSLENDSAFGKQLAKDFHQYNFEFYNGKQRIFGIFDSGTLVGLAMCSYEKQLNLAWLRDIFIVPDHRRMGYGRALVLTVLSDYPDIKWHYQAARDNVESTGLAKSLGFTLEGAGLSVV